ncbi:MAG: ATP-dependent DNA helicase [Bacteroidetes bacterium RIFCSPLOWO2_02_FULL_36_8]|nr:MAG: ATP-dependent DNA helicase [Bacteroidetes bacterium RIFCSPLOWO2_02_FULL_36_8]OFY69978.1 MAG: ATP-dependent DNA helicase [Bacteroidetes bacterium RIFCSPLOWO2_12_FULL_37_12]
MDFLSQLNPEQQKAVTELEGPSIIIAGAGSGKTRVLTYRIAWLLSKGVKPYHILALTFTNKASKEMKKRIGELIGPQSEDLWMGTFHRLFGKMLRIDGHYLGYQSNFTIYDTEDSKCLLRNIIKELMLDEKAYPHNLIHKIISLSKNRLIDSAEYLNNSQYSTEDSIARRPLTGKIYSIYQNRCFQAMAMDFDDLLLKMYYLLRDFNEVLEKYQNRFRYILVDEYQDTNFAQYMVLKKLAAKFQNICVVGDDSQSIYGFRGADISNILNFKKDYPNAHVFRLEQNYRSTKTIVEASNNIILNNRKRLDKKIWTENDTGAGITLLKAVSDNEEGWNVANSIFDNKMNQKLNNADFAILYRTNAQSRVLEESLRRLNLPYRIYGGLSFYQRREIKDLLAYLRLTVNSKDEEALRRIINYPRRGIGESTISKLQEFAQKRQISLWESMEINNQTSEIGTLPKTLPEFEKKIKSYQNLLLEKDAYSISEHVAKTSGIMQELREDKTLEGVSRYENLQELLNGIKEFVDDENNEDKSLVSYLQQVALYTDADKEEAGNDTLSLMTIHSAKGLEFPFVYITGLEENLFPSSMALGENNNLEEERRLFYVAVTRAKVKLFLSYAKSRYKWGQLTQAQPSRFLNEIDSKYFEQVTARSRSFHANNNFNLSSHSSGNFEPYFKSKSRTKNNFLNGNGLKTVNKSFSGISSNLSPISKNPSIRKVSMAPSVNFTPSDTTGLDTGMRVEHARFGIGKVIKMSTASGDRKATILFENIGEKTLLLGYARLKILE